MDLIYEKTKYNIDQSWYSGEDDPAKGILSMSSSTWTHAPGQVFRRLFLGALVPEEYAEKHNISFGRAKEELLRNTKAHKGLSTGPTSISVNRTRA